MGRRNERHGFRLSPKVVHGNSAAPCRLRDIHETVRRHPFPSGNRHPRPDCACRMPWPPGARRFIHSGSTRNGGTFRGFGELGRRGSRSTRRSHVRILGGGAGGNHRPVPGGVGLDASGDFVTDVVTLHGPKRPARDRGFPGADSVGESEAGHLRLSLHRAQ